MLYIRNRCKTVWHLDSILYSIQLFWSTLWSHLLFFFWLEAFHINVHSTDQIYLSTFTVWGNPGVTILSCKLTFEDILAFWKQNSVPSINCKFASSCSDYWNNLIRVVTIIFMTDTHVYYHNLATCVLMLIFK